MGALVRLRVPAPASLSDANALADDFARAVLPPVLKSLRESRLDLS